MNVDASAVTTLTGTAAAIATAISAATIDTAVDVGVTVDNGAVLASDLNTIDANTTAVVDASAVVTSITGTAAEFATLVTTNAATTTLAANYAATITSGATVAQANVVDADTAGVVTATITEGDIATLATLSGTGNAYTVTVTDLSVDAAALNTLDGKTTVNVDASAVTTLTGTTAAIATAITAAGINTAANLAVTLTDAHTLSELKAINDATTGTITLSDYTVALSGSAADVAAALAGIASYTGNVTLSAGAVDATLVSTIAGLTSGTVDGSALTAINGTTTAVLQALTDLDTDPTNFNSTLTGVALATEITAIEAVNGTGTIDGSGITAVSGSAAAVIQALLDLDVGAGSAAVTITDQPMLAQLKAINDATTGSITLQVTNGAFTGTAADLTAAFDGTVTSYTGTFTITDSGSIDATVLSGLGAKTSGLITAANITTLTGSGTEVRAVTDNLATSGNDKFSIGAMVGSVTNVAVTLSGNTLLADLTAIDQATTGFITAGDVTSLSGSVTNLKLVTDNLGTGSNKFSIGTMTVNVTDADLAVTDAAVTAANLLSLDTVTDGVVSFASGATVTGNYTDVSNLSGVLGAGVTAPTDFNLVVTGVVSTSIDTGLPPLLSFYGGNTTGTITVEGTNVANTLNFSTTTDGLTIDGGAGNDVITGTAFADVLKGGAGIDTVTLGTGADTLVFNSLSGIDTIADYNPTDDLIQLAKSAMAALGTVGGLTDAEFESGVGLTAAVDATTRIFYNETTGDLFYDADGSGAGAATQLATFSNKPTLTHNEFFIA